MTLSQMSLQPHTSLPHRCCMRWLRRALPEREGAPMGSRVRRPARSRAVRPAGGINSFKLRFRTCHDATGARRFAEWAERWNIIPQPISDNCGGPIPSHFRRCQFLIDVSFHVHVSTMSCVILTEIASAARIGLLAGISDPSLRSG